MNTFNTSIISPDKTIAASVSIIILAAGLSSRLGRPKQLLKYNGSTLLQTQIEAAAESVASSVAIVVGSNENEIMKIIDEEKAHVIFNEAYEEGIGSSIRCGVKFVTALNPVVEAIVIMVSDQPFVTNTLIDQLVEKQSQTGKKIISSSYGNTYGPPTLFHKTFFEELLQMTGDTGARKIIQKHMDELELVPFPQGSIDIDTEEDYRNLTGLSA